MMMVLQITATIVAFAALTISMAVPGAACASAKAMDHSKSRNLTNDVVLSVRPLAFPPGSRVYVKDCPLVGHDDRATH